MPEGGTITVSIARKDSVVRITFSDTGTGIHDNDISKIFDPYYTTKESGSGLGLMNVHSIVSKHNGRISVSSHYGSGTTIEISLPMQRDALQLPYLNQQEEGTS